MWAINVVVLMSVSWLVGTTLVVLASVSSLPFSFLYRFLLLSYVSVCPLEQIFHLSRPLIFCANMRFRLITSLSVYDCAILTTQGTTIHVHKRYSAFLALHTALTSPFSPLSPSSSAPVSGRVHRLSAWPRGSWTSYNTLTQTGHCTVSIFQRCMKL